MCLLIDDSSSLLSSLLLLASFFFRFGQPKAQHCVPRCLLHIVSVLLPIHNCKFWVLPIWRRLKIPSFKNHRPKTIECAIQSYFEISGHIRKIYKTLVSLWILDVKYVSYHAVLSNFLKYVLKVPKWTNTHQLLMKCQNNEMSKQWRSALILVKYGVGPHWCQNDNYTVNFEYWRTSH